MCFLQRLHSGLLNVIMELYHLRTFVAVAAEQSVTRAAERLYTTPPSVSAHIKALESELKVDLFVRTPRGMRLTQHGELLRAQAEQTLQAADALVQQAATFRDQLSGELRIGLNAAPERLQVPALVAALHARHPQVQLHLVNSVSGQIVEQVRSGALDGGFLFGPAPSGAFATLTLGEVDLVVAAPRRWEPQLRSGRWLDIAALAWIASTVYCPFEAVSDTLFAQHGVTPRKIAMTDDGPTKVDLIRAGVGAAVLEESEARSAAASGDVLLWSPQPLRCPLNFVWLQPRDPEPALLALRRALGDLWNP